MQNASSPATAFWRDRGALSWARVLPTYWAATGQAHRAALIAALRKLPRFESLRELGSCAGTNIKMIREAFPWCAVEGVELSYEAATFSQLQFGADPYVRIVCNDMMDEQQHWEPQDVDVTVSCYTLAYVAPEELEDFLLAMVNASKVGMVIIEPQYGEIGRVPNKNLCEWRHDYTKALDKVMYNSGRKAMMSAEKLNEPVEICDGIMRIEFMP